MKNTNENKIKLVQVFKENFSLFVKLLLKIIEYIIDNL